MTNAPELDDLLGMSESELSRLLDECEEILVALYSARPINPLVAAVLAQDTRHKERFHANILRALQLKEAA
jgi:hypothetical protein